MMISKQRAIAIAEIISDLGLYHLARGEDGQTDRHKLSKLIKDTTGHKLTGEKSLNKVEAALSAL